MVERRDTDGFYLVLLYNSLNLLLIFISSNSNRTFIALNLHIYADSEADSHIFHAVTEIS